MDVLVARLEPLHEAVEAGDRAVHHLAKLQRERPLARRAEPLLDLLRHGVHQNAQVLPPAPGRGQDLVCSLLKLWQQGLVRNGQGARQLVVEGRLLHHGVAQQPVGRLLDEFERMVQRVGNLLRKASLEVLHLLAKLVHLGHGPVRDLPNRLRDPLHAVLHLVPEAVEVGPIRLGHRLVLHVLPGGRSGFRPLEERREVLQAVCQRLATTAQ
mmetsp:Transcript_65084/g.190420  ORF Transcript_65084/g.190420 Transcript_65084/m.190420 type:complete len:212 (-) Transcript_65084:149-784(-)